MNNTRDCKVVFMCQYGTDSKSNILGGKLNKDMQNSAITKFLKDGSKICKNTKFGETFTQRKKGHAYLCLSLSPLN